MVSLFLPRSWLCSGITAGQDDPPPFPLNAGNGEPQHLEPVLMKYARTAMEEGSLILVLLLVSTFTMNLGLA